MANRGRPPSYTQEKADAVCLRMSEGESLRSICRDPAMPGMTTVWQWVRDNPTFAKQYALAREAQADALAEDLLEIADDSRNDWMVRDGKVELNSEHINRSRLRIDTRKWLASKILPKRYGERMALAGDPEAPLYVAEVPAVAATAGEWLTKHKPGKN